MKKNLNISVTNKIAKYLQRDGAIVCGNSDYQITFTFDAEWDAYPTKTARFIWNGKYWDQPFTGNVCPVPIIQNAVFVIVGVYAGDLRTTTPASIPCKRSILCDDVEINDVNIEACREQAVSAAYRAESAVAKAEAANPETQRAELEAYIEEKAVESNTLIASELAKKMQLKPEFAKSEEWLNQNGDTTKLYVLPTTNTIWAYIEGEEIPRPDTTVSITKGLKINKANGTKEAENTEAYSASGFIEIKDDFSYTLTRKTLDHACVIVYYKYKDESEEDNNAYHSTADNFMVQAAGELTKGLDIPAGARFFRLRIYGSTTLLDDTTFTVTAEYTGNANIAGWQDTGHAFVPADYEPRIIKLEEQVEELNNTVINEGGVPDYVIEEANRVIGEVIKKQTGNTITFLAVSDTHNLEADEDIKNGNLHAGQAMKIIADSIGLDFATMLGDHSWGASFANTPNQSPDDLRMANRYIADAFKGIDNYRANGNHDILTVLEENTDGNLTQGQMYAFIGRYNKSGKSYFYRDYEDKKVRVIMLNTVDGNNIGGAGMTPEQLLWFAQSLDLSAKSDASEWQILILSHHPLDWNQYSWGTNLMNAANILAAYINGSSVTFTENEVTNTYNFTGKNKAKIIGQIHGHLHNYKVDYIHSTISGAIAPTTAKRIAIPNACFDRNNTYAYEDTENLNGIDYGEETTYFKAEGTADTAFCVVTIDLDNCVIYADHYGAGYDREINY